MEDTMHINEVSKLFVEANINKQKTLNHKVNRFQKYVRYPIDKKTWGIYFIYLEDGRLAYIGETINSIKKRIGRHKRSMNDPSWSGERSGYKFVKNDLQDEDFMIKYITAEDLNITTKHDLLAVEGLFVQHLKPIVYSE